MSTLRKKRDPLPALTKIVPHPARNGFILQMGASSATSPPCPRDRTQHDMSMADINVLNFTELRDAPEPYTIQARLDAQHVQFKGPARERVQAALECYFESSKDLAEEVTMNRKALVAFEIQPAGTLDNPGVSLDDIESARANVRDIIPNLVSAYRLLSVLVKEQHAHGGIQGPDADALREAIGQCDERIQRIESQYQLNPMDLDEFHSEYLIADRGAGVALDTSPGRGLHRAGLGDAESDRT
jgi:hypothetical protein